MKLLITIIFGIVFFITVLGKPAFAGGMPDSKKIIGVEWKWEQSLYNNDQKAVPKDINHYTIIFNPDNTMKIRADCNRAGGKYSLDGNKIVIQELYSTKAMCPPDSLGNNFLKDLDRAVIYFFKNGSLYLDLKYDTGTMKFKE